MNEQDLAFMPAWRMAELIASKELSPVEIVDLHLERIERLNPKLNAYLTITARDAREQAREAQAAVTRGQALGPLHGVPVSIKDLEHTRGIRTTLGSLIYKDFVPDEDSIAVQRLRAAGAIILGKTNTPEFGLLGETKNRLGEDCRNPWDTRCTTGGSSGGSAAAVVAGLTPLATGSDSAGSINNPAGFCGAYGIKPTLGRVPSWPLGAPMLFIHSGPIARTVRDAALMLEVIAGHDQRNPLALREAAPAYVESLSGALPALRIAWSPDMGFAPPDAEVLALAEQGAFVFEALGCRVEEAQIDIGNPFDIYNPINQGDTHVAHGELLEEHAGDLHPESVVELEPGRHIDLAQYVTSLERLWHFRSQMAEFFETHDLLITPTNPVTAFPIGEAPREIGGRAVTPHWSTFMPLFICWNMTGYPTASVPCGFASNGLPVGILITARWGREDLVLRASAAFEKARPWAEKHPELL